MLPKKVFCVDLRANHLKHLETVKKTLIRAKSRNAAEISEKQANYIKIINIDKRFKIDIIIILLHFSNNTHALSPITANKNAKGTLKFTSSYRQRAIQFLIAKSVLFSINVNSYHAREHEIKWVFFSLR